METAPVEEVAVANKLPVEAVEEPPLAAVMEDKPLAPPPCDVADEKALIAKIPDPPGKKASFDRDVALAKLEDEKRVSFIKAWEESEKSKVENKALKKFSDVSSWENTKKAAIEAQLKKIEEQLEKKKADYAEKMKNKVALIHKQAEEKRAMVEARRGEDLLKANEMAAKFRATGHTPKSGLGCLGC